MSLDIHSSGLSGPASGPVGIAATFAIGQNDGSTAGGGYSVAIDVFVNSVFAQTVHIGDATGGGDNPDGSASFSLTPGFVGSYEIKLAFHDDLEDAGIDTAFFAYMANPATSAGTVLLPGGKALIVGGKFCTNAAACCCMPGPPTRTIVSVTAGAHILVVLFNIATTPADLGNVNPINIGDNVGITQGDTAFKINVSDAAGAWPAGTAWTSLYPPGSGVVL